MFRPIEYGKASPILSTWKRERVDQWAMEQRLGIDDQRVRIEEQKKLCL